jgi:hypothetical protein
VPLKFIRPSREQNCACPADRRQQSLRHPGWSKSSGVIPVPFDERAHDFDWLVAYPEAKLIFTSRLHSHFVAHLIAQ